MSERELVGTVAVDSGQISIVDPAHINDKAYVDVENIIVIRIGILYSYCEGQCLFWDTILFCRCNRYRVTGIG